MTYKEIIREIARMDGTTPAAVEAVIQEAIEMAYANPDPEVREQQKKIKCKGDIPTPEEFIMQVATMVHDS